MSSKQLKRNMSGFFAIPYEQVCVDDCNDSEEPEICSCVQYDKIYIKEVLYNNPVTIVFWSDNTKTISKAYGSDTYSKETGLSICILKKLVGSTEVKNIMEDWISDSNRIKISDVRKSLRIHPNIESEIPQISIKEEVSEKKQSKFKIKK